jgi:IS5 family transposase
MIKTSLFADQEREAKLNKLGDALQVMEQHVDSPPLLRRSTLRHRAPAASAAAVRLSPPN